MPASEKTWRNQNTLNIVFGCTGLLLLIATVWMFGADHSREWKQYQRQMRKIDVRLTDWRMSAEASQQNADQREKLNDELTASRSAVPPEEPFEQFVDAVENTAEADRLRELNEQLAAASNSPAERQDLRSQLDDQMAELVSLARFQEDNLLSQRKFKAADYDEKRANYDLGIRDEKPPEVMEQLQREVEEERLKRDELTRLNQGKADYRKRLESALRGIQAPDDNVKKQLLELEAEYDRLASTRDERQATYFTSRPPFLGKRWLELPILDAFNSPLKVDNLWTKNLTITNGSFGEVRRFDRCTTCHKAIERSAPGSAIVPLYESAHVVELDLPTPDERPDIEIDEETNAAGSPIAETVDRPSLRTVYGMQLADHGLVDVDDVTIRQILPETPATQAQVIRGDHEHGLRVGDVLLYVRDTKVLSEDQAQRLLLDQVEWGQPLRIKVLRGLPQPFSSHPRLDLYVGSLSPHRLSVFGCTICHEGQGSATEFMWASHSPNDPAQQDEWVRKYGWFNNHHWIYPMTPARFSESTCLKCHHDVVELEIAEFDEPPAPKLTHGYDLVREYGCFGCHEINGYNGPDERIGPDMRLEPSYSAAAAQVRADSGFAALTEEQRSWVQQLIQHPERSTVRHDLLRLLKADARESEDGTLAESHYVISALEDVESPGNLRKVGPSLRYIERKVGESWLYDWLRDPTHFRPSTRMPRFFGLWDHLDEGEQATSARYEPIEMLGIVKYLLGHSQPLELIEPGPDAFAQDDEEQIERGKLLFETRGCLACHQHRDFPVGKADQGPDLSNIGDKFAVAGEPGAGRAWMYSWLKNPSLYHARTKMPDLYLDPITDAEGNTTDPSADIAVYLLNSSNGWSPLPDTAQFLEPDVDNLDALVREHLQTKLYIKDVQQALEDGRISPAIAATLDGAELVLTGQDGMSVENKLLYVGQKTITKYGCYGCHDIPGFETAKPIGTGLADWGRKDPSKLAFEHIAEYVTHGHGHDHHDPADHDPADESMHVEADDVEASSAGEEIDETFYIDRLLEHDRTGFIWQKLKEPRSYDFAKARNKDSFNDRLRMPLFPLNDVEREAVITFVLGLVAEPPAYEFVYHADEKKQALIAGHQALTKFNCVGCHIVDPEKWTLEIPSGLFEEQPSAPSQTYPFMPHQFTSIETDASTQPNSFRGTVAAQLHGMPDISGETGEQRILDEEGDDIEDLSEFDPSTLIYPFELWRPTLIDGNPYQVGVVPLEIEAQWIRKRRPTFGGDLTHWLLPRAVELEKETNPQADGKQAYGWLPPPLLGEGEKVQTDWLHSFLLEPFKIRPAVLMRMPKFNMSPQEATDLANYFAAKDGATYPYEYSDATADKRLDQANHEYQERVADVTSEERPAGKSRLDDAMNIVTSNDYCVQCHMVADFVPKTSDRAMAPDLSAISRRLRPDYLKRWLANPKQILPYTPMPVNVKYNADDPNLGGVAQTLYDGTSVQQLQGLVDLLMNYSRYAKSHAPVAGLVQPAATTEVAAEGAEGAE